MSEHNTVVYSSISLTMRFSLITEKGYYLFLIENSWIDKSHFMRFKMINFAIHLTLPVPQMLQMIALEILIPAVPHQYSS